MPPPLTEVALVIRLHPAVNAFPSVAGVVSSFLVPTSSLSLAEACRFGSLKLLDHIWAASCTSIADRTPWWSLANYLRSDRHYHAWAFSEALEEAAGRGDLEVVTWLFAHFPGCIADVKVVEAAAKAGHLPVLQFLHANSIAAVDVDQNQRREGGVVGRFGNDVITVYWGRNDLWLAARNGHLKVVRWLYEHTSSSENRDMEILIRATVRVCDLSFAEWLLAQFPPPPNNPDSITAILVHLGVTGHLELILQLYQSPLSANSGMEAWSSNWDYVMEAACRNGHLNVVKWLLEPGSEGATKCLASITIQCLLEASAGGHLHVVQFLADSVSAPLLIRSMSSAASSGHLHVLRWLQSEMSERHGKARSRQAQSLVGEETGKRIGDGPRRPWTPPTSVLIKWMDESAARGHLEMLRFLHAWSVTMEESQDFTRRRDEETHQGGEGGSLNRALNDCAVDSANGESQSGSRKEVADRYSANELTVHTQSILATHAAMDQAAANGHLEVVQWLRANGLSACTTAAIDNAAVAGHLEMVQWLHSNMQADCTTDAMDGAATNGHLEMVRWLHANRSEGCTTKAMDGAASFGHLKMVQWLYANRSEGCTPDAVEEAVNNGHVRVVRWLFDHFPDVVPTPRIVTQRSSFDMLQFLHSLHPDTSEAVNNGHVRHLRMLVARSPDVVSTPPVMTERCSFDTILFLHVHRPEAFSDDAVESLRASAPNNVAEWLAENYPS